MKTLSVLLALCLVASVAGAGTWYTVYYNPSDSQYTIQSGNDRENGVAWAEWADEMATTGWDRFNLESSSIYEDDIQAYGAGYLEGAITSTQIWQNWYNTIVMQFNGTEPTKYLKWFSQNLVWVKAQVSNNARTNSYWRHVQLVLEQLQGMVDGYNYAVANNASMKLGIDHFILLNADGDMETLEILLDDKEYTSGKDGVFVPRGNDLLRYSHCSSLIRVTTDLSEIYAGHTTWSSFYEMLRVFKNYNLRFSAADTVATSSLFSSYPGFLSSVDDYYQTSSNLVVIETTNGCFNTSLIKEYVSTASVLSWLRVVVANRMARSGEDWVKIFSKYNSGTYNNQWIIVDYNKFTPFQPLADGTLWIAEQIPGNVISEDVTHYLRLGYWPSFNVPFFNSVYDICGFVPVEQEYGTWMSYDLSPRGEIFRRDANNVKTLIDARNFLRYNDWEHDPLAAGNPGNQISSRFDLVPKNVTPPNPYLDRAAFGGIDTKITSRAFLKLGMCYAQSGPTLGGKIQSLPPFNFNDWPGTVHEGQPDVYNFPWITMPQGSSE